MRNHYVYQEDDVVAKLIAFDLRVQGHETTMLEKGASAPRSTIPLVSYVPSSTEQRDTTFPASVHCLRKGELYGNIQKVPEWIEECDQWIIIVYSRLRVVAWLAEQIATSETVPASAAA